ncbi:MAG: MBL fold metallo-hydrolase [Clostridia bacterium]|nr:MBL fold metallo-hydrolase [Clostridia bacterium]
MELCVLGRCGPFPRAGEACSGYLLCENETHILLDCGAGVLSRLRAALDLAALDAVVLSHLHFDHCGDMAVLRYALEQLPRPPLPVYCPMEPAYARAIFDAPVFELRPISDGRRTDIGAFSLRFHAMTHPVPSFGAMISGGGARLFYTGDTGWFEGLPALAKGADALLADCCFTDADADRPPIHLSARQAGRLARAAGAGTLYCTHLYGGADGDAALQKEVDFSPAVVVQERGRYII